MFIGINRQETDAQIQTFIDQTGFSYPILKDTAASVYDAYELNGNISPFPLDYIIDREGIIAYGATGYEPIAMQITLDELIAGQCDTVRSVTVRKTGSTVELRWAGLPNGQYDIYTTLTDPSAFPAGWTLEATLPSNGYQSIVYADTSAVAAKKFYTVMHNCP